MKLNSIQVLNVISMVDGLIEYLPWNSNYFYDLCGELGSGYLGIYLALNGFNGSSMIAGFLATEPLLSVLRLKPIGCVGLD